MQRTEAVDAIREAIATFAAICNRLGKAGQDVPLLSDRYIAAIMTLTAAVSTTCPDAPWFDHRYDWLRGVSNWMWYERAVFGMGQIREGDSVLDLCCGDGFFAGVCFATYANVVHGLDRDVDAIATAQRLYNGSNVEFHRADVVQDDFPLSRYDVVTWFEGVEHLSKGDGDRVLEKIAAALSSTGKLIGSTPVEGGHHHPEHNNVFNSIAQLRGFLRPHFSKILLWTSRWSARRVQGYFLCENPG